MIFLKTRNVSFNEGVTISINYQINIQIGHRMYGGDLLATHFSVIKLVVTQVELADLR